ncbi:MAG: TIM barrel protein [Parcubacteria group bacterium]|jgi:sugar phosphate isomerase/epimerase
MAIAAILLPDRLKSGEALSLRRDLLQQIVGSKLPWGIEITGSIKDFYSCADELIENAKLARELGAQVITMHAPVSEEHYFDNAATNLCKPDREFLLHLGWIAGEIGVSSLTFHAECFMRHEDIQHLNRADKDRLMVKVGENLYDLARLAPGVRINVENMPEPLMGNAILSSAEMVYDPLFSNVNELAHFCEVYKLGLTFNSCHWGARSGVTTGANLMKSFRSISRFVTHISLADTVGEWLDRRMTFQKGIVPGQGKLGDNLVRLVHYLRRSAVNCTVTVEVEDRDSEKLEESRLGLNWLMWHLNA